MSCFQEKSAHDSQWPFVKSTQETYMIVTFGNLSWGIWRCYSNIIPKMNARRLQEVFGKQFGFSFCYLLLLDVPELYDRFYWEHFIQYSEALRIICRGPRTDMLQKVAIFSVFYQIFYCYFQTYQPNFFRDLHITVNISNFYISTL